MTRAARLAALRVIQVENLVLEDQVVDYLLEFEWKSGARAGGPGR